MTGEYVKMPPQQGWQCPLCGRVYSPTTEMCLYCGNGKEVISTTATFTTPTLDWLHHDSITKSEGE